MLTAIDIEIAILILVTFVYALFDVFNKRNVPDVFVYATLVIGVVAAAVFNYNNLPVTFGIAALIGIIGYAVYRAGFIGGGDILEFVFIALVLPFQQVPLYVNLQQYYIPFIVSVLIGAGFTSLIFIPVYYLLLKRPARSVPMDKKNAKKGVFFLACYAVFMVVLYLEFGISLIGAFLILLLALASVITMIYERRIYVGMVEYVYPKQLENGDMIAINMMSSNDLKYFSKIDKFGRLATNQMIAKLKKVKRKLPVYRDSVPFSLFVFFGVIISLAIGNLILFIVGV